MSYKVVTKHHEFCILIERHMGILCNIVDAYCGKYWTHFGNRGENMEETFFRVAMAWGIIQRCLRLDWDLKGWTLHFTD